MGNRLLKSDSSLASIQLVVGVALAASLVLAVLPFFTR